MTYQRGRGHKDLVAEAGEQLTDEQSRSNVSEDGSVGKHLSGRLVMVGAEHEVHHGLLASKRTQRHGAVHLRAELDARGHAGHKQDGAGAGEAALDGVGKCHDGIPGAFHLDVGLADGAAEWLVGALAVGDPAHHAVLVSLEGAGARVDPRARGIGGLRVDEANEAPSGGIGGAWCGDGGESLGRHRWW